MDKTKRDCSRQQAAVVNLHDILMTQDEIIDWLTAHDERERCEKVLDAEIQPLCRNCQKSCKMYGGGVLDDCNDYAKLPSITSELEAGLEANGWQIKGTLDRCTFILLPTAKYRQYCEGQGLPPNMVDIQESCLFHNIPVWPAPCKEVVFGTD
jgi:hypothetical protein